MTAPRITVNTLAPAVVNPGGSTLWTTEAVDDDARTATINRNITDSGGAVTVVSSALVVSDPLTYGVPTCSDPKVSFVVSPTDPTKVTVNVAL